MEPDEIFRSIADVDGLKRGQYTPNNQGKYILDTNPSWPETVVNGLYVSDIRARIEEARRAVLAGQKSPLYYHMARRQMNTAILAKTVGMTVFRVKRHLRPEIFSKLKPSILDRYAHALVVSQEELKSV
ncbi:MAG: hypothetical protein JW914_08900 [Syntrophaceae bacterium]|nr:hypothetical protein [Syntrophaceae bacterium]